MHWIAQHYRMDSLIVFVTNDDLSCHEFVLWCKSECNLRVFLRRAMGGRLKGQFMSSAVLSSLIYGLHYCSLGKRDKRCLDRFYMRLVKRILFLSHLSYDEEENSSRANHPSVLQKNDCGGPDMYFADRTCTSQWGECRVQYPPPHLVFMETLEWTIPLIFIMI